MKGLHETLDYRSKMSPDQIRFRVRYLLLLLLFLFLFYPDSLDFIRQVKQLQLQLQHQNPDVSLIPLKRLESDDVTADFILIGWLAVL